ncbi:MAG: hypothetical protein QM736_30060 [Vicinamibacterales bacterium]
MPACSGGSARNEALTWHDLLPYSSRLAGMWIAGQISAGASPASSSPASKSAGSRRCTSRPWTQLLAKDLAFFQSNYSGSLTKRALGFARRFEDVFDVLVFLIAPTMLPLASFAVGVVGATRRG